MVAEKKARSYRPTEAKYNGGAEDYYVTYDLPQKMRGKVVVLPRVKRVYLAGTVVKTGAPRKIEKRTGRMVRGFRVTYVQSRAAYQRKDASRVRGAQQTFTQVVEVPEKARNVKFYSSASGLGAKYKHALQRVR
jgi:hypothetical protein